MRLRASDRRRRLGPVARCTTTRGPMDVIELRDIVFQRQGRRILDGISWNIVQGQHWALLGANGSGKTTLLKILTGYEWASEGTVGVLGRRYGQCDLRELRKTIGWVSLALEYRIPRRDTALETVASGLDASLGVYRSFEPHEWDQARAALDHVNGLAFAGQSFETLSQGEQQRALIARALVNRPALLVLDEPCAGLDPAARASFLADLENLAQRPDATTIVFVTHHIEEIGPWVSHVHALKDGRTLAQAPIAQVLTTAILSDALSYDCEVLREDGHYRLRTAP